MPSPNHSGQQGFIYNHQASLNKKAYGHIVDWRNRLLQSGRYPYVSVDDSYLRCNWGGVSDYSVSLSFTSDYMGMNHTRSRGLSLFLLQSL
ncbi:MAG: hypothetical protein RR998_02955 [Oscillospiraceae bacterium]